MTRVRDGCTYVVAVLVLVLVAPVLFGLDSFLRVVGAFREDAR